MTFTAKLSRFTGISRTVDFLGISGCFSIESFGTIKVNKKLGVSFNKELFLT